jgi:hypothetical protein
MKVHCFPGIATEKVHRVIERRDLGNCGNCRKQHGKPSVGAVEKCPDIPMAVVQYSFTHKQYTQQHNGTYITTTMLKLTKNT